MLTGDPTSAVMLGGVTRHTCKPKASMLGGLALTARRSPVKKKVRGPAFLTYHIVTFRNPQAGHLVINIFLSLKATLAPCGTGHRL